MIHLPKQVWTPQINLGIEVRIPETYVPDLNVRLSVYRRIGDLVDAKAIDQMIAELVDRFGPLPDPVRNLFAFIELKQLCRSANVEKIDAGPKGISLSFRDDQFARPEQLIGWIAGQVGVCNCALTTGCLSNPLWKSLICKCQHAARSFSN